MSYTEEQKKKNTRVFYIIVAVIVALGLIAKLTPERKPDHGSLDDYEAVCLAEKFILRKLKSPSSAKFPNEFGSAWSVSGRKGRYVVSGHFDAQNSFGAMTRNRAEVVLTHKRGDTWTSNTRIW